MRVNTAVRLINLDETLIALCDVPESLPRPNSGRKVSLATVYRWVRTGLEGVDPLETLRVGMAMYTSRQALERFFERVSQAKDGHRHGPKGVSTKAGERASAELAASGL